MLGTVGMLGFLPGSWSSLTGDKLCCGCDLRCLERRWEKRSLGMGMLGNSQAKSENKEFPFRELQEMWCPRENSRLRVLRRVIADYGTEVEMTKRGRTGEREK